MQPQLEKLDRGLVAVKTEDGVYLSWRFLRQEARGATQERLIGADFIVLRNGEAIATVTDSTNYQDANGTATDVYAVAAILDGAALPPCKPVKPWANGYLDIPLHKPEGGVTPAGQAYEYTANDLSVGDVDGDGQYELFVKWDPTNSQDVSIKGYTGKCYIDCIHLDGTLLWRVDMGVNIRAGAHYTQFMVYDFDGDGRAEMAVKTAPGSCITRYRADGSTVTDYITLPERDVAAGVTHGDNYVCSAEDYRRHMAEVFMGWRQHPEVVAKHWPATLEECFGIEPRYAYPLCE
ncbi:MAG: rhamnogalacturonan lyase, partial [Clostridiales bacterium]|nr:rhamnogalacturonan lyase [Clostridiales bacterium]